MRGAKVAVVGGGILGLTRAYMAARRGHSVMLFERGPAATGASIRNFGMIWPIGQPAGEMYQLTLGSREMWLQALDEARLPRYITGSLHVAHRDDEAEVLREFAEIGPGAGYECHWRAPREILECRQAVRADRMGL